MKHILTFILFFALATSFAQTKVMSYNIRYANNSDGDFSWGNRKDKLAQKIVKDACDIICMQEVLKEQIDFLNATLPNYGYFGVGRDDGKQAGEYVPVYYNKKRFALHKAGTIWLSDTPDTVSNTWNAACLRIATWVVLNDLQTEKKTIVINTHFDHESQQARINSADLINKLAFNLQNDYGRIPIVLCGDFNATVEDASIKKLMQIFSNTRSKKSTEVDYSFIGFNEPVSVRSLIDFIFIRTCNAKDYKVDADNYGLGQLSDHLSVSCTIY